MTDERAAAEHYGTEFMEADVDAALRRAGLGEGRIPWEALAPLDQFHVRGLAATTELAAALAAMPGAEGLDVGCGLGGPARFLAANYGCRMTGIDLNGPFVELATTLTRRCGMEDRVAFQQADALDLPFPDARFDFVWTQHVAMNIADRGRLYAEIARVLKPGGRLAVYDVAAGDGGAIHFPVPWASRPEESHLLTADAMRAVLATSGFTELAWSDPTAAALAWFAAQGTQGPPPPLGLHLAMGARFAEMAGNFARNLREGKAKLVQAVLQKVFNGR